MVEIHFGLFGLQLSVRFRDVLAKVIMSESSATPTPFLFYMFAEPMARGGRPISTDERKRHRDEITDFAARVAGDEVAFGSASYRE
jgi:hypothetical protein